MIIRLSRKTLNYFRRKALANPTREIYGLLAGERHGPNLIQLHKIYYPKMDRSDSQNADPNDESVFAITEFAEKCGLRLFGSIHSHIGSSTQLSSDDFKAFLNGEEEIQAVCNVMDRKTWITFWVSNSSLACKIEYID